MSSASKGPYILIAVLLGLALVPTMPYGYYSIMRWLVCGAFVYLAVGEHAAGRTGWVWIWAVAAGVYNPIFRVHADREVWTVANLLTIAVVAIGAYTFKAKRTQEEIQK